MKNTILSVVASFLAFSVLAQQPVHINPKIDEVTVYLDGAEIRFTESIPLKKGSNTIHFLGISPSLMNNSVQVTVQNVVEVVSVSTESNRLDPRIINPRIGLLYDSIAVLEDQIALVNHQLDAFNMERKTLEQNQHLGSSQASVSLADLTKAADFFRERTLKINQSLWALNKKLKQLTSDLSKKLEMYSYEKDRTKSTRNTIVVTVNSKTDQVADFQVRHLVQDCGWEASYDIVATEINKPVTLKYKADIYNETGINWNDVRLSLSTGAGSQNATRPYLTTWTLNYTSTGNEGQTYRLNNASGYYFFKSDTTATFTSEQKSDRSTEQTSVSELNVSFDLEQPHSVLANGQPYQVGLKSEVLQATFEYLTIPKMELSAFLLAKVTGWEKLNLIDGVANVYFGNSYIGESDINTRLIADTLELSLGRDNQIVVSRNKIEDTGNTPSIGGKRSESFVYEIQLKNNRRIPVSIKIQDQIPVSQEKDITVDVADISGASLNASSGRLQWVRNLNAGEAIKYKTAFTVRYPKNKTVNVRKSRVVTPRYRH